MGNFTLDFKKAKGTSDARQSDHIERKIIPDNADPKRIHLNRVLIGSPDGVNGRNEAIVHRLKTAGIKRKITNDQVREVRVVLSGTHEDMMALYEKCRLGEWCSDNIQWLQQTFGKKKCCGSSSSYGRKDTSHSRNYNPHRDWRAQKSPERAERGETQIPQ